MDTRSFYFRGANHRRRRSLDEHMLQTAQCRHSFYLEAEHRFGDEADPRRRRAISRVWRAPALGEIVHDPSGAIAIPLRKVCRFSATITAIRSEGEIQE